MTATQQHMHTQLAITGVAATEWHCPPVTNDHAEARTRNVVVAEAAKFLALAALAVHHGR